MYNLASLTTMISEIVKVNGWKSRKVGSARFYRCPDCGACQDMLLVNSKQLTECFKCQQKFPSEDECRKGLAEEMVGFWVKSYAARLYENFGIEAPNEKATNLRQKLGHLKIDEGSCIGVKCF
jgi:hypothetical protein